MPGKSKRRLRPFIEKSRKRDQGGAPGVSARHFLSSSSTSSYFLSRFLPLPPLPFFSLPFFFFFYLIREPAITTATRHWCSAIPRLLLLLPFSIFLLLPRWMIFHRVHVFLPIVSSLRLKTPLRRHVRPPERLRSLPTSLMLNHSRKNCNQSSLLGTRVEGRK